MTNRICKYLLMIVASISLSCSLSTFKVFSPLCDRKVLSESEIRELAGKQLDKFCLREKIDKNVFSKSPPSLTFNDRESIWVIDYEGGEYFIRFIVDYCGSIETSYGRSGKIIKIE